jgi:hypothetical protein
MVFFPYRVSTADGDTRRLLVGLYNRGGPAGGDFMDYRDFLADEGGEFRRIRNPKLDQIAVRTSHRPDLLYLREGGQIDGATLKGYCNQKLHSRMECSNMVEKKNKRHKKNNAAEHFMR